MDEDIPAEPEDVPLSTLNADLSDSEDSVADSEYPPSTPSPYSARSESQEPLSSPPESIQQPPAREPPSPLILALGLLFEKINASRQDYVRTREVLYLAHSLADSQSPLQIPYKIDTLKRQVRAYLPMLRLLRKAVPVVIEKQPSLPSREKGKIQIQRQSWLYWYDPIELVKTILSAPGLTSKMTLSTI